MTTHTPPDWFAALFRELVVALQPRGLKPDACGIYYNTLAQFGEPKLRAAAATLKRQRFFPTSGEWYTAAINVDRREFGLRPLPVCPRCDNRGLIVVRYHDGDPFDLAICDCDRARVFRMGGPDVVRQFIATPLGGRIRMTDDNRIGFLEDFAGEP